MVDSPGQVPPEGTMHPPTDRIARKGALSEAEQSLTAKLPFHIGLMGTLPCSPLHVCKDNQANVRIRV